MARKNQPNAASDAANVNLPGAALHMAGEHPEVWAAFQHLGEKASRAGPLDARYYYLYASDGVSGTWGGGTGRTSSSR